MSKAKPVPAVPRGLELAIYEQQKRAIQLHNLLLCLDAGIESSHDFDVLTVVEVLTGMAEAIWEGLDTETLVERAKELEAERIAVERAAALQEQQQEAKERGALQ
jgi:hypothetical protein